MFSIPLPPKPVLEQYKKRSKELLAAVRSDSPEALREFAEDWFLALARIFAPSDPVADRQARELVEASVAELRRVVDGELKRSGGKFVLANAQFLIANLHGFANWKQFAAEIDERIRLDQSPFEEAVDAIVGGDAASLHRLLAKHPGLTRERSRREHRCTLLHYVSANGVEDYRQKTPANAVEIARSLLNAGAEVDALAETYGGGRGQTTMNLLVSSAHPHIAGLQSSLAEVLLDFGAAIEGLDDDGSPVQTALAFGYLSTAETLVRRGARIGNITVAASLNRLDLVKQFVAGELPEPKESLLKLYWSGVPRSRTLRQKVALHWAATHGRTEVVKYFLGLGMDPASSDDNRMNLLHNATSGPHMDLVRYLLSLKSVPLESENVWGGTVINSMLHFANDARRDTNRTTLFAECAEALLEAGADVSVVDYNSGIPSIDAVLETYRRKPVD